MPTLRKLISLFLIATVLISSSVGASLEASDEVQHGLAQSQVGPLPSPGGHDNTPGGHGCVGHLSSHLIAPLSFEGVPAVLIAQASAVGMAPQMHFGRAFDSFFRPPRFLLS